MIIWWGRLRKSICLFGLIPSSGLVYHHKSVQYNQKGQPLIVACSYDVGLVQIHRGTWRLGSCYVSHTRSPPNVVISTMLFIPEWWFNIIWAITVYWHIKKMLIKKIWFPFLIKVDLPVTTIALRNLMPSKNKYKNTFTSCFYFGFWLPSLHYLIMFGCSWFDVGACRSLMVTHI